MKSDDSERLRLAIEEIISQLTNQSVSVDDDNDDNTVKISLIDEFFKYSLISNNLHCKKIGAT